MAKQPPAQLAKFITNLLGRCPDAVGLLPDPEGFVTLKALIQAVKQEPGYGYVQKPDINDLMLILPDCSLEMMETKIRAKDRSQLPQIQPAENLPKLLYTPIRRKAHAHVLENGLAPASQPMVVLCLDKDTALKMGRRKDGDPVILEINTAATGDSGTKWHIFGQRLFLANYISPKAIVGPPLPKEKPKAKPEAKEKPRSRTPGSFAMQMPMELEEFEKEKSKKDKKGKASWKKDRRRIRQEKESGWD